MVGVYTSPMRRLPALPLLALLLAPLLGGCRYTFIPVIPRRVQVDLPARITSASLRREGRELLLGAQLSGRFEPGYLEVVWFEQDRELGRDSVYLDAQQRSASFRLLAPDKGSYRAMLSFGGVLLRQLELREAGEL